MSSKPDNKTLDAIEAALSDHFLQKRDLDIVLKKLRKLEDKWEDYYPATSKFTLCTPMVTYEGDLLFELQDSLANVDPDTSQRTT